MRPRLTYANVISTVCLFLLLAGGTAIATHAGGPNTISTADIINGQVRTDDIGNGEVKVADVGQGAVATDEIANGQVQTADIGADQVRGSKVLNDNLTGTDVANNSLKGADIDESTLSSIGGGGPAGGDLTGTYPDPEIAPDAVGTSEVAADSLTGADVDESTLSNVRPIAMTPVDGGVISSTRVGDLDIWASCRGTHVIFRSATTSTATLNWQFSEGTSSSTTVNAGGTVISPFGTADFAYGTSGRLEGQWIFSTPQSVTTVILHAFQGADSCEVRGTAQWAPV